MRPDPQSVEKARARLRLSATGTLDSGSIPRRRTTARRMMKSGRPVLDDARLLTAADPNRCDLLARRAAALLHARDMASMIKHEDVVSLEAVVPKDLFQFALANVDIAPARDWKSAEEIAQTFEGDIDLCRAVWIDDLPAGTLSAPPLPKVDAHIRKRIRAALAAAELPPPEVKETQDE